VSSRFGTRARRTRIALALALVELTATRPAAAAATHLAGEPAPETAKAQELYQRGRARFETSDYKGAIEFWTDAYAALGSEGADAQVQSIRSALVYNISTAQGKWHELDGDVTHLRQARQLLVTYAQMMEQLGEDPSGKELTETRARIAELEARIDAEATKAPPASPGPANRPATPGGDSKHGKALPLLVSGGVLAGLGLGGVATMAAGMALGNKAEADYRDDPAGRFAAEDRGRTANALAIAGGVAGGVLLVTGAVLLAIGAKRRGKKVAAAPTWIPSGAGMTFSGRF
jgi:TolA-binding protein